nr:unnamed protein product [Digitaria exilis]
MMLGGALFSEQWTFLGMNLLSVMGRTIFLPSDIILDRLIHFQPSLQKRIFIAMLKPVGDNKRRTAEEHYSHPEGSRKVKTFGDSRKDNTFGVSFGDKYPSGVWGEFSKNVSSNIHDNVVALASFNGGTKFFACTGFFINNADKGPAILTSASLVRDSDGGNKIVAGLRIKVLLPDNKRCEGKLEHYSLHYNVALVGIGGPLVDVNGRFLGMNYYDRELGTPFLFCNDLCKILNSFWTKE